MKKYNQHRIKDKNGHMLSSLEAAELRDKAKVMYLKERLSLRRIAAITHVSGQTVSNWKKVGGWDEVAERAEKAKEKSLLKDLTGKVKISQLVDIDYVIEGLRAIAENGVTESNRVAAFKAMGDWLGMFDNGKPEAHEAPLIIEYPVAEDVPSSAKDSGSTGVENAPTEAHSKPDAVQSASEPPISSVDQKTLEAPGGSDTLATSPLSSGSS